MVCSGEEGGDAAVLITMMTEPLQTNTTEAITTADLAESGRNISTFIL